ncbi:MAG TPA: UDP-N-acetylmuramate--L-alanine ligase, partial [Rhodothermales bacterium]|nr:UDP-N-acetylmuramate--L-alanine ligase [Rhodothermales bacterium]
TEDFKEEFARAFFNADLLVITDVFPSREAPRPGITGALIADLAKHYGHRHVHYVEDKKELPHYLKELTQSGDVVITMGAGDIWRYGEAFLQLISNGEDNGTGSA